MLVKFPFKELPLRLGQPFAVSFFELAETSPSANIPPKAILSLGILGINKVVGNMTYIKGPQLPTTLLPERLLSGNLFQFFLPPTSPAVYGSEVIRDVGLFLLHGYQLTSRVRLPYSG